MTHKYRSLAELQATRDLEANLELVGELIKYRDQQAEPSELGVINKQIAEAWEVITVARSLLLTDYVKDLQPEAHVHYLAPGTQVVFSYGHDHYAGARGTVTKTRIHDGEAFYDVSIPTSVMRSGIAGYMCNGTWVDVPERKPE
jgi:hypothetical protein